MTSPNIWTPGGKPFANVNNSVEVQHITPTAGQQDFTLTNFTYAPYTNSIQVYLNGVLQRSGTDYLETSESSIRFLSANLTSSDTLSLIGTSEFIPTVSADLVSSQQIIVSAPTSILSIGSAAYVPFRSGLQVYVNGVLMYPGRDYIEITGSRIEFTQPLATDDEVLIRFGVNSEISGDAAGISYILPGGVVRDVAGKLGEFVSVLDFIPESEHAAIRAGTSAYNCTSAIQSAIDYAFSTAKIVYIPAGIYKVMSLVTIKSGVILLGCGSSKTPRYVTSSSTWEVENVGTVFSIAFGAGETSGCAFKMESNSKIDGCVFWHPNQLMASTNPVSYPPVIALSSDTTEFNSKCFMVNISNSTIVNAWFGIDAGVLHEHLTVSNVNIGCFKKAILVDMGTDSDTIDDVVVNSTFAYKGNWPTENMFKYFYTQQGVGLHIGRSDGIRISRTNIIGGYYGAKLETITSGHSPNGIYFDECVIEGQEYPVHCSGFFQYVGFSDMYVQVSVGDPLYFPGKTAFTFAGLSGNKSLGVSLDNVNILSSTVGAIDMSNVADARISDSKFSDLCKSNLGYNTYAILLNGCERIDFSNTKIILDPNNNRGVYGFMNGCSNVRFESCYTYGQRQAIAGLYAIDCNNVTSDSALDEYSNASPYFQKAGTSTNCYGEVPTNRQGSFTPLLTGFPTPNSVSGRFEQQGKLVHVFIEVTFPTAQNITNPTAYIHGLPLTVAFDSVLSSGDGNTAASYGNAVALTSMQRIYPASTIAVDQLIVSGTYLTE